jgi:ubiquitin C-terminal hydrolase
MSSIREMGSSVFAKTTLIRSNTNYQSGRDAAQTLPTVRFRALHNRLNDCYLNATLQMVLTVQPFITTLVGNEGETL